jgi:transcriptional regulator with XRE-family HTH domain
MYANLKFQIFKLGIHQNYLAKEVGMAESVLSKIIHGYREPSASERRELADYLRVEENWLFEKFDVHLRTIHPTLVRAGQGKNANF